MTGRYSPTERLGVNAVERFFLELEWIFREQHTTDVGIDAQVEICEAGVPTGRTIALQIKSGVSYFKEENASGYVFRGSLTHLDYWLKHSLPVVLVLYDHARKHAWWCWVNEAAGLTRLEKGWTVCVPKSQKLNMEAKPALKLLAMPHTLNHARLVEIASRYSHGRCSGFSAILDALHAADESIVVISPYVDDTLFLALAFCSHRARVRLITSPKVPESAVKELQTGDHESIEWKVCGGYHEKLIVIDNFLTIAGSANLTLQGWRADFERIDFSWEEVRTSSIASAFESLWSGKSASVRSIKDQYEQQ